MPEQIYIWRPEVKDNHFRCCRCGKKCTNRKGVPRECVRVTVDEEFIVLRCPRCGLTVCKIKEVRKG